MRLPDSFTSPAATRWLGRLSALLLLAVGTLWLVALVLAALLHFWIVPRADDWREWVQDKASQQLGLQVQIGRIEALSNGLIPALTLVDVQLQTPGGESVLSVPRVDVALSPRSLLRLGVEQLRVQGVQATLRRDAHGGLWLGGWQLGQSRSDPLPVLDWVFAQPELALVQSEFQWSDELLQTPTLMLRDVQLVLRNGARQHRMRLDATPAVDWVRPLVLMGEFEQRLWSLHPGRWQDWTGQLYAQVDKVDAAQLQRYVGWQGLHASGEGGVRAWLDWAGGQAQALTADVQLQDFDVHAPQQGPALQVRSAQGRLGVRRLDGGVELFTQGLQLHTVDGLHWPGGDVRLRHWAEANSARGAAKPWHGELEAQQLNLGVMRELAKRLPLPESVQEALEALAPAGVVQSLQAQWEGRIGESPSAQAPLAALAELAHYKVDARVQQLGLGMGVASGAAAQARWPGVSGLDTDISLDETGGRASLRMPHGGVVKLPWLAESAIPLQELSAQVAWQHQERGWQVDVPDMQLANADTRGRLRATWWSQPATNPSSRLGRLELDAQLRQTQVQRIARYLPTELSQDVRDYLHAALVSGVAPQAEIKLSGDLDRFPYEKPEQGLFSVKTTFRDLEYAFAPAMVLPAGSLPWVSLEQAQGQVALENNRLRVQVEHARVPHADLQLGASGAEITDLYHHPHLVVTVDAEGDLATTLAALNHTPVLTLTEHALEQAKVTGRAFHKLELGMPLDKVEDTRVRGTLVLPGNDVDLGMDIPPLTRAQGIVRYTEQGFSLSGVRAQAAGGALQIEGGLQFAGAGASDVVLNVDGVATAEGLRALPQIEPVATLARLASGQSSYQVSVGWREGQPEVRVKTSLEGMALDAPAPLGKSAEQAMPVLVERTVMLPQQRQDKWQITVGAPNQPLAQLVYVRDISADVSKVLRGTVALGLAPGEGVAWPDFGVAANVHLDSVDVQAWQQTLAKLKGDQPAAHTDPAAAKAVGSASNADAAWGYLPSTLALRVGDLAWSGRHWTQLVAGIGRQQQSWLANVNAAGINGYLEYHPTGRGADQEGRLYARLSRLVVPAGVDQEVEQVLDSQPTSLLAMDLVIDDFELNGKQLGRLELDATNQGPAGLREWRMNRFNIQLPEAVLSASGKWAASTDGASVGALGVRERRRTHLDFKLDVTDSGALLARFGMPNVIKGGQGQLAGQISWMGSPVSLHYPSMSGNVHVQMDKGQFLKADPGIAKLLGVLSLQSLPRRLLLDFHDLFADGFAFDFVRGDVDVDQGIAKTNNLQMKGVLAGVFMDGQADIARETQKLRVVVVPEINVGSASLLWSTVNPVMGLSTFVAQLFLRGPLVNAATQEYVIDGTWTQPRMRQVERGKE